MVSYRHPDRYFGWPAGTDGITPVSAGQPETGAMTTTQKGKHYENLRFRELWQNT